MRQALKKSPRKTLIRLSIPGIRLLTAASLIAYAGDGSRFYTPAQLRNHIALVPRIDQPGSRCIIGRTVSFGCKPVRKNIIQGALSIEKPNSRCPLQDAWRELRDRCKKRQIIGISIANRMITIGWTLQRKGELYNGSGDYSGLKQEGLEAIDCSSFLELQWWPPEFPNQDSGQDPSPDFSTLICRILQSCTKNPAYKSGTGLSKPILDS